jgi:hypothetical protein
MEREFPPPRRAGLQGSTLVGLLAHLGLADRPAAPPSFVEGLGRWLGWKEAIPLSAVLQPSARPAEAVRAPARASLRQTAALEREFLRVQQALQQAIEDDRSTASEDGQSFLPFRRRCFGLQQAMEAAVGPLRTQLRTAVSRMSPALAQLAALDAVMAATLAPREQAQLAQLPVLLEKHFNQLRAQADTKAADTAPTHTPWLQRFRQDMQQLLLAERDLRLQPAQGLLATLQAAHATPPDPERPHE